MQEPSLRSGFRVLAVASTINPEAVSGIVLDPKIVPHCGKLGIAFPPFTEHAFRPVGASDPAPDAAPGERGWRMVG
jgi:hypothetical protein